MRQQIIYNQSATYVRLSDGILDCRQRIPDVAFASDYVASSKLLSYSEVSMDAGLSVIRFATFSLFPRASRVAPAAWLREFCTERW